MLPSSFVATLAAFAAELSARSFENLRHVLGGLVLRGRPVVTDALRSGDAPKHYSAYHRVFSDAAWDLDAVGLHLLDQLIAGPLASVARVELVVDDTLARRRGRHVFAAGMHYDPMLTGSKLSRANRSTAHGPRTSLKSRGHCWVMLGVVLELRSRPGYVFCLPILSRLYLSHKTAERLGRPHRTKSQLAVQMLAAVCARHPQRRFELLADSAYASRTVLSCLPSNCELTAAWNANAALYSLPEPYTTRGQRRKRGERLGGMHEMLDGRCARREIQGFGIHRRLRVAEQRACFYATPSRLVKVIATEPMGRGGRADRDGRALYYTTCTGDDAQAVLRRYARRWSVEVTIHEAKGLLGLEASRAWCEKSVARVVPTVLLTYSHVVLWFEQHAAKRFRKASWPWWPDRSKAVSGACFADMLETLRAACLRHDVAALTRREKLSRPVRKTLDRLIAHAARAA